MSEKPRVFITRPIPDQILSKLEEICDVEMWHTSEIPAPTTEKIHELDGLLTYGHEPITDEMMASAPNLKVISNMGVGYDHIDTVAAKSRGIEVGNTPDVLSDTTADMTFALLLSIARNVVPSNGFVRSKQWTFYDPNIFWGQEIHHATIGIVGMGRIGYAVAKRALGFDMKVLYFKRNRRADWEEELGIEYATLDQLLESSDFVTLHPPMSSETHHLIGKKELVMMKPNGRCGSRRDRTRTNQYKSPSLVIRQYSDLSSSRKCNGSNSNEDGADGPRQPNFRFKWGSTSLFCLWVMIDFLQCHFGIFSNRLVGIFQCIFQR